MEVVRGEDFEACFESGVTGLVGTVTLMVIDNVGGIYYSASTADIIETPAGSGNYCATRDGINVLGHYTLVWSEDGTYDDDKTTIDDLFVIASGAPSFPPLPSGDTGGPVDGPCFAWCAPEDVALCCGVEVGSDFDLFDEAITSASMLLYRLSGRQWKGQCERVVRANGSVPCGFQVLARGHVVNGGAGWMDWDGRFPANRILLPNYPVTEITQVLIDGDIVPEDEYRLDGWRFLQRMADADGNAQAWPAWARIDLESTEDHTFEVSYLHGTNPPQPGIDAAQQLACEIYKSCPGNEGVGTCALPKGTTKVVRAGIEITLDALRFDRKTGSWKTGMKLVDLFLNAYNPHGIKRPPAIWSADAPQFAQEVGTTLGS